MYVCLCTVLTTGDNMQVSCGVSSGSVFMYLSVHLSVHCSEVICWVRLSDYVSLFVDSV